MKKCMLILVALTLFASPVFAADFTCVGDAATCKVNLSGEDISVLSKNVEANVTSSLNAYAATTYHTNGSKQYGASSDSTKIYSEARDDTTAFLDPGASNSAVFESADWTTL